MIGRLNRRLSKRLTKICVFVTILGNHRILLEKLQTHRRHKTLCSWKKHIWLNYFGGNWITNITIGKTYVNKQIMKKIAWSFCYRCCYCQCGRKFSPQPTRNTNALFLIGSRVRLRLATGLGPIYYFLSAVYESMASLQGSNSPGIDFVDLWYVAD